MQTVLVQDEALKRANARIQELEAAAGETQSANAPSGFLDSMRESLFGRRDATRGSVPSVRSPEAAMGAPAGFRDTAPPPSYPHVPVASGGSFLGTAASAAAGVIGGALLLDGIRSMFGHGRSFGAIDPAYADAASSPWAGSAADSDLARQAGIDHIGQGGLSDNTDVSGYGLADNTADQPVEDDFDQDPRDVDSGDFDTGGGFDSGDGSDFA